MLQILDAEVEENAKFWRNVEALLRMRIEDELAASTDGSAAAAAGAAIAPVAELVEQALQGSLEDLRELEQGIADELGDPGCPDPDYWRAVKARCALQALCAVMRQAFRIFQACSLSQ
jgi:hypothetical protein